MTAYFLEHVRATYKIPTTTLDDKFVTLLQYKSGVPPQDIKSIISFIQFMDDGGMVSKEHLLLFHRELEQFYKQA
jgi:hemerythrin-like domain-containing protein